MFQNVGGMDRTLRLAIGIAILALGAYFKSWWGLIGLLPLLTGLVSWCPLYLPLRLSTRPRKPPAA